MSDLLHPDSVRAARERGGEPDPERPDHYDDVLDRPELGKGEGDPLVDGCDTYEQYPRRPEDMSNPKWEPFVRSLLAHPRIGGYDDAVAELSTADDTASRNKWRNALERAAGAFDIDAPALFEQGQAEREQERESRLAQVLGYSPPDDMVSGENTILVATLYTLGLGVSEVAELIDEQTEGDTRPAHVHDTLRDAGLLRGATRDEQRSAFQENDGRLGGMSVDFRETGDSNPSVDIDAEKVAKDPNISVE